MFNKRFLYGYVGGVKFVSYGYVVFGDLGYFVDFYVRVINYICCGVILYWYLKFR